MSKLLSGASVPLHVDYVTDSNATAAANLFAAVLSDPLAVVLLASGGVTAVVALLLTRRIVTIPDVATGRRTLASYKPYLPWMLRLSVGLPLVGAGFAGYFISPSVMVSARVFQVVLGFLLLFGLATRVIAIIGLGAYLVMTVLHPTLVLASEYVGAFLAILIVGAGQPSADGMLRRIAVTDGTLLNRLQLRRYTIDGMLGRLGLTPAMVGPIVRVALGANFFYLGATQKLMNPGPALAVVNKYNLAEIVPVSPELWVVGAGLAEVTVGILLIAGVATRGVAAVAFVLFTSTLFGLPDDPVLAHVSLFGLASALMVTGSGPYALSVPDIVASRSRQR